MFKRNLITLLCCLRCRNHSNLYKYSQFVPQWFDDCLERCWYARSEFSVGESAKSHLAETGKLFYLTSWKFTASGVQHNQIILWRWKFIIACSLIIALKIWNCIQTS